MLEVATETFAGGECCDGCNDVKGAVPLAQPFPPLPPAAAAAAAEEGEADASAARAGLALRRSVRVTRRRCFARSSAPREGGAISCVIVAGRKLALE